MIQSTLKKPLQLFELMENSLNLIKLSSSTALLLKNCRIRIAQDMSHSRCFCKRDYFCKIKLMGI